MDNIGKIVGRRVKELRQSAGLTQKELAKIAKCSDTTINRLEKGKQLPHTDTLDQIAIALRVPVKSLMIEELDTVLVPNALSAEDIAKEIFKLIPPTVPKKYEELISILERLPESFLDRTVSSLSAALDETAHKQDKVRPARRK